MIEYQSLIDNGVMGIIIAWFMFRMEKVVKNNTEVLFSVKENIERCKNGE
tara:strand:+ start:2507 stop:2656 length:150 start_codon:yes stop_codon:yes gene_type:complete